jgi:hypothetical protein
MRTAWWEHDQRKTKSNKTFTPPTLHCAYNKVSFVPRCDAVQARHKGVLQMQHSHKGRELLEAYVAGHEVLQDTGVLACSLFVCVRERERVCVCVCERERERERERYPTCCY